jgi:hypothetical protein
LAKSGESAVRGPPVWWEVDRRRPTWPAAAAAG